VAERLSDSMREELEAIAGKTPRLILGRSAQGGRAGTLAALFRRGYIQRGGANGGYVLTEAGRAALGVPAVAAPEVTDAMVDAYLKANDAYWKRADELPTPPNKWRTGTPREATRESLRAALAAGVPGPYGSRGEQSGAAYLERTRGVPGTSTVRQSSNQRDEKE
jgi:hypothetical protein